MALRRGLILPPARQVTETDHLSASPNHTRYGDILVRRDCAARTWRETSSPGSPHSWQARCGSTCSPDAPGHSVPTQTRIGYEDNLKSCKAHLSCCQAGVMKQPPRTSEQGLCGRRSCWPSYCPVLAPVLVPAFVDSPLPCSSSFRLDACVSLAEPNTPSFFRANQEDSQGECGSPQDDQSDKTHLPTVVIG